MKKELRHHKVKYLLITTLVFLLGGIFTIYAADRYVVSNGNWNATTTWSATANGSPGASVPVAGDNVFIQRGFRLTVNVNATISNLFFSTFTPGYLGELVVNDGITLNVTGLVQLNNVDTVNATISGLGTLNCNTLNVGVGYSTSSNTSYSHTLTTTIKTLSISNNLTINSYNGPGFRRNEGSFNHNSGTLTINGSISTFNENSSNTSTFTLGNSSPILILNGSIPFSISATGTTTISLNGTGSTVNYSYLGTQTVRSTTYANLILSGSGVKTANNVNVTGNLAINGAATATPNSTLTVLGSTTLSNSGVLTLGASEILSSTPFIFNGGTLRTGVTSGFTETVGTLNLNNNSTVALGTGNHSLIFAESSTLQWLGTALTITGWSGTVGGTSGTAGKIFVGTNDNGLTDSQISKINFNGFNPGALILSTGEIVPSSPNLKIAPSNLSFGFIAYGSTSVNQTYTISGRYLTGFPGNIAVNAPLGFEISLTHNSGFGSTINIPFTTATLSETTVYVRFKPLASNTNYNGNITISGGGATSKNVSVSGTSSLSSLYCSSSGNMSYQTSITSVNFNTITNVSAKPAGYSDYSATVTNVIVGNSYPLSVRLNTDGNYTAYALAWIDWNGNGNFNDAGEEYNLGTVTNQLNGISSISPTVEIPEGIVGNVRMRISAKYNAYPTSCELNFDGEVEDYNLNILPREINTGTLSGTTYCAGASVSVTYSLTGTYTTGNIFTAQLSDGNGNFNTPITIGTLASISAGTIAATIPSATTIGTAYRIRVVSNNPTVIGTNNGANITINPLPSSPTANAGSGAACTQITANWSATSNATGYILDVSTVNSFANFVTGYNNLNVGNVLTANVSGLTAGTTYFYRVRATNSCGTSLSSSTITYATLPAAPSTPGSITGTATQCPSLTNQVYSIAAVTNATNYNWTVPTGWTITSGSGTSSITVTTGTAGQNGTISVSAQNSCGTSSASTLVVTVSLCNTNNWKGNLNTDWNTPANWSMNMVPGVDADIIFDNNPQNNLVLDQNRSVNHITNSQATNSIVTNGYKLTIKGNLVLSNNAKINASHSNSTIEFAGTVSQSIPSGIFVNDEVFNLTVNNANNVLVNGTLKLLNTLTTTSGKLDALSNSPSILYRGTVLQSIEGNQFLNESIYNLTVDNSVGVNLNTNFSVANSLLINTGKKLTINPSQGLTVNGAIINNGGTGGLVLKSDATGTASLLHNSANVQATVQRYISGAKEDWHFLASPVSNQTITESTWLPSGTYGNGTGYDLYVWDEPGVCWVYHLNTTTPPNWPTVHSPTNFVPGRGYLYAVQDIDTPKQNKRFEGTLNNGNINYSVTNKTLIPDPLLNGFNLVGNPYPSSIDWRAASGWTRTNLKNSVNGYDMWIWNPAVNNYGVVNSTDLINTNGVSNFIAPMQGFFVLAEGDGNLGFTNAIRTQQGASNWLRTTNTSDGIIKVNITSDEGFGADEVVLKFGANLNMSGAPKLYSTVKTAPSLFFNFKKIDLSVRHISNSIENPSIPINFKAGADGNYKLSLTLDQSAYETLILEDKKLKIKQDLKVISTYNFKATVKDATERFVLHFSEAEQIENSLAAKVYFDGDEIVVDLTQVSEITNVKIYDLHGREIIEKNLESKSIHKIPVNIKNKILVVRAISNEKSSIQKVLIF